MATRLGGNGRDAEMPAKMVLQSAPKPPSLSSQSYPSLIQATSFFPRTGFPRAVHARRSKLEVVGQAELRGKRSTFRL